MAPRHQPKSYLDLEILVAHLAVRGLLLLELTHQLIIHLIDVLLQLIDVGRDGPALLGELVDAVVQHEPKVVQGAVTSTQVEDLLLLVADAVLLLLDHARLVSQQLVQPARFVLLLLQLIAQFLPQGG